MSRHWGRRTDQNQKQIAEALRACGAFVEILNGTVDLLVGFRGVWFVLEVKNPKGKNRLQASQDRFLEDCDHHGLPVHIVRSVDEALVAIGIGGVLEVSA